MNRLLKTTMIGAGFAAGAGVMSYAMQGGLDNVPSAEACIASLNPELAGQDMPEADLPPECADLARYMTSRVVTVNQFNEGGEPITETVTTYIQPSSEELTQNVDYDSEYLKDTRQRLALSLAGFAGLLGTGFGWMLSRPYPEENTQSDEESIQPASS